MSSGGFHVHGPHDHELEHARSGGHGHDAADHGAGDAESKALTNKIALFTAVIATVGALFAYMGGATQANAGMFKNNAAIKKTEASNQWNYFQAKSTKQSLAEISRDLTQNPAEKDKYQAKVDRYEKEKQEIKAAAEALEKDSKAWDAQSDDQMHLHHRWAQATTVLQVSIALAAIALLTRRRWLVWGMYGTGALGVAVGLAAVAHL